MQYRLRSDKYLMTCYYHADFHQKSVIKHALLITNKVEQTKKKKEEKFCPLIDNTRMQLMS